MTTLTVTERGQITIRKEVLKHLGIKPGDKIEIELLPGSKVVLQAPHRKGTIDDFIGILAGQTTKVATLEEIKKAIEEGWAGKR
jgi:AbrB family looped-hinge helix DNA binding protein